MDGSIQRMLNSKAGANYQNKAVQLASWRPRVGSGSHRNRGRWLLSGLFTLAVIAFLWMTCRPLTSRTVHFLLVTDQSPLHGNVKEMYDFAELVKPAWHSELCCDKDLDAALNDFDARDTSAALIVYSYGVPVLDGGRVHLYTGGLEQSDRDHSTAVSELLEKLSARERPTLLLLDVAFLHPLSVVDTPELAIWMLEKEIDKCFQEHPNPNMAVVVQSAIGSQSLLDDRSPQYSLVETIKQFMSSKGDDTRGAVTIGMLLEHLEQERSHSNTHNSDIRTVFAANCAASFHSVPLLPVRVAELKSADTMIASHPSEEETKDSVGNMEAGIESIRHPVLIAKQIVAPSPAAAIRLHDLGMETAQLESARSLVLELSSLAEGGFEPVLTNVWLQTAEEKYPHWPLVEWVVSVLKSSMKTPLKSDLIKAKLLFDELAIDMDTRKQAPFAFEEASVALADAERSFFSPVMNDSEHYIGEQSRLAAEIFERLMRRASILRQASGLSAISQRQMSDWLSYRVRARSEAEDSLFKLLTDHAALNDWSRRSQVGDLEASIANELCRRIQTSQQRLEENRNRVASELARSADRRGNPVEVAETTSALLATKVRIARLVAYMKWIAQGSSSESEKSLSGLLEGYEKLIQSMHSDALSSTNFHRELDALRQRSQLWLESTTKGLEASEARRTPDRVRHELIDELAKMMVRLGGDALSTEMRRLQIAYERCCKLAVLEQFHLDPWPYQEDTLIARVLGSIEVDDEAIVQIQLASIPGEAGCQLEIEYDATSFALDDLGSTGDVRMRLVDSRKSPDSSYRSFLTFSGISRTDSHSSTSNSDEFTLPSSGYASTVRVRRIGEITSPISLNIRRLGNARSERLAVPLQVPREKIVDIRWDSFVMEGSSSYPFLHTNLATGQSTDAAGVDSEATIDWIVHSNQTSMGKFWASSTLERSVSLQVRLLAMENRSVPLGTISKSSADGFLEKCGQVSVIAEANNLICSPNAYSEIRFPPRELAKDQPLVELGQLVCEVTDLQSQSVQFAVVRPTVVRPSALVDPQISYDAPAAIIDLKLVSKLVESTSPHIQDLLTIPVMAKCELFDPRTQTKIAETQFVWDQRIESSFRMSTARATGPVVGLRITINEWPSSFVYQFTRGTSASHLEPSVDAVAVSMLCDDSDIAFRRGHTPLAIGVWSDISDNAFRYGRDVVRVGVDKDRDRTLANNEFIEVNTPVTPHFHFAGITHMGSLKVVSRIEPKRMLLPTEWLVEGRYDVLAELVQVEKIVKSEALQIIVDDTCPVIDKIDVVSAVPATSGKPVAMQISCSDFGLSGVTGVRVGWARNGLISMEHALDLCVAQQSPDGIWSVQVPTDALVPGVQTLLVQAEDKVGNLSDVKTLDLSVLTDEQIATLVESEVGAVIGRVQYVKLPVANMKVSLKKINPDGQQHQGSEVAKSPTLDASLKAKNADSNDDSNKVHTYSAQTDSDGRFAFPAVSKGQYELVVEGLYRGMNRSKTVTLNMLPPNPTYVDAIRID